MSIPHAQYALFISYISNMLNYYYYSLVMFKTKLTVALGCLGQIWMMG